MLSIEDTLGKGITIVDTNMVHYVTGTNDLTELVLSSNLEEINLFFIQKLIGNFVSKRKVLKKYQVYFVEGIVSEYDKFLKRVDSKHNASKRFSQYNKNLGDGFAVNLNALKSFYKEVKQMKKFMFHRLVTDILTKEQLDCSSDIFDFLFEYSDKEYLKKSKDNGNRTDEDIVATSIALAFTLEVNVLSNGGDLRRLLRFYYFADKQKEFMQKQNGYSCNLGIPKNRINLYSNFGKGFELKESF